MPRTRRCVLDCPDGFALSSFPSAKRQPERRKKWLRLLGVEDRTAEYLYACERHFSASMRAMRHIKHDAVPDLHLNIKRAVEDDKSDDQKNCMEPEEEDKSDDQTVCIEQEKEDLQIHEPVYSTLLDLTRQFLEFLRKRRGICTVKEVLYSMDTEAQQRFDDIYQVLVGAGIIESRKLYSNTILKLRSYASAVSQPPHKNEAMQIKYEPPKLEQPIYATAVCRKSVEIQTDLQLISMDEDDDEDLDTTVPVVTTKSVQVQADIQLTQIIQDLRTPVCDQAMPHDQANTETVEAITSPSPASFKLNQETQTGSMSLCGFVEMSLDNKVKFLNCCYCKEVVPIWNWHAFATHILDAHLGCELEYMKTEGTTPVATSATDTASRPKRSKKIANVKLPKRQILITAKPPTILHNLQPTSQSQPSTLKSAGQSAPERQSKSQDSTATQHNLIGYIADVHKEPAEVLMRSVDDLIELVLDEPAEAPILTDTTTARKKTNELMCSTQIPNHELAFTYAECNDYTKLADEDQSSLLTDRVNANKKDDSGASLQVVPNIEDAPSTSLKRKIGENLEWNLDPLSDETGTELTATAAMECKRIRMHKNEITSSKVSKLESAAACDKLNETTNTSTRVQIDQIAFKRTQPEVVMDFLEMLKARPVLWNACQGTRQIYLEAVRELANQLNFSWNSSFTQTSISNSIRYVRRWYRLVLTELSLLEHAEDYQHKYLQYFDKCAEFLPTPDKLVPKSAKFLPTPDIDSKMEPKCAEFLSTPDIGSKLVPKPKSGEFLPTPDIGRKLEPKNSASRPRVKSAQTGFVKLFYKCSHCDRKFPHAAQLERHEKVHKPKQHICATCGEAFSNAVLLSSHSRMHDPNGGRKCNTCGKVFSNHVLCRQHRVRHGEPKHMCEICSKRFYFKPALTLHLTRHRRQRDYVCEQCGKRFVSSYDLKWHKKGFHERQINCEICNQPFSTLSCLVAHKKRRHFVYEGTIEDLELITSTGFRRHKRITDATTQERRLLCEICNATFKMHKTFHNHRAKKHGIERQRHPVFHTSERIRKWRTLRVKHKTAPKKRIRKKRSSNHDLAGNAPHGENKAAAAATAAEISDRQRGETSQVATDGTAANSNNSKEVQNIDISDLEVILEFIVKKPAAINLTND